MSVRQFSVLADNCIRKLPIATQNEIAVQHARKLFREATFDGTDPVIPIGAFKRMIEVMERAGDE